MTTTTHDEQVAAAFAFITASCYGADQEVTDQLLREAHTVADGYECALAVSVVCLQRALDLIEEVTPGFRAEFLSDIGHAWAADDLTTE